MSTQLSNKEPHRIKTVIRFGFILLAAGFANNLFAEIPAAPQGSLSHDLGALTLTLDNEEKHCQLQYTIGSDDSKTIPLLLEAPCYWITGSETKQPLHFSYNSVDVDHSLLVAGTALDWSEEKKSYHKLPNDSYCTQYLQGVVISKGDLFAVDERMVAAHCETGLAMDEKIFYAMAHNPQRYQTKSLEAIKEASSPVVTEKVTETPTQTTKPKATEEKSFLDSVADTIKGLFSDKAEEVKE